MFDEAAVILKQGIFHSVYIFKYTKKIANSDLQLLIAQKKQLLLEDSKFMHIQLLTSIPTIRS